MELAKLKWQCRRGSLELDLLLNHYLDTVYLQACAEERARFAELLELDDEVLLAIFTANRLQATRPENR
ncbi:MAG: succinate dehydrogenase assembly factor 2 [Methylobacter sp.]|uniref:succinate dehydrogenase assembly factor 2 n=1 Tax=Methylovulum miyakonense TaxID=645578 RepID=UPI00035DFA20|nr:succinate dehydrogenase assembly factor 2 [Methylovulum miyakonense]PPD40324.1 MAG: succinate dehydrogenase assembly factor 2 [Methylobacter sp.]